MGIKEGTVVGEVVGPEVGRELGVAVGDKVLLSHRNQVLSISTTYPLLVANSELSKHNPKIKRICVLNTSLADTTNKKRCSAIILTLKTHCFTLSK